jgi:hypothetical protein
MPPAARGTLFEKTVPLDPLQKLFIKVCFLVHLGAFLCIFVANLKLNFYEFRVIPGDDDGYFSFYFFPGKMLLKFFQEAPVDFFEHFG